MPAQLIDGKAVAKRFENQLLEQVAAFRDSYALAPTLHFIRVEGDPTAQKHVRNKMAAMQRVGMSPVEEPLAPDVAQSALIQRIRQLNADVHVDGILVQLPLPVPIDEEAVLAAIDPNKDVDGLTPRNVGLLALGRPGLVPATPLGCLRLIDETASELAGKRALVIGRSALVGRPVASLLLARDMTVTIAHSYTRELAELVAQADVVVSAAGVAGLVRGAWIKPGAVVIDVGQNRDEAGKLCGDVEFEAARERAGFITPVPGGVGPMTVAMLLENTLRAASSARASRGA